MIKSLIPGNHSGFKLLASNAARATLAQLIPHFEHRYGEPVGIVYDLAETVQERLLEGEAGDFVVVNASAMGELVQNGKVTSDAHAELAQSGIGVAVRKGTPRPDISTMAAFRRALMEAKSIAYTTGGVSGRNFSRLVERLGIAAQVQAKSRTRPSGVIGKLVVNGEAEMAVQHTPQLLEVDGLDYLGPVPSELQVISVMAAGVLTSANKPDIARSLLRFLMSKKAAQLFKTMGYDRPDGTATITPEDSHA